MFESMNLYPLDAKDLLSIAIHLIFAVIYLALFGISLVKDPYKTMEEPMPMRPLVKSGVRVCSIVSTLVGMVYLVLFSYLIYTLANHQPDSLGYVWFDLLGSITTIIMLFLAAYALMHNWHHSVGLFIIATGSSSVDALFIPNTFSENLLVISEVITFLGSVLLVISVGWLYSVQYFYYQKTHP